MEDYNENHAAPLSYVNAAVAQSSQADRQWVLDNIRDIILNRYTDEDEPVIIDKLHRLVEFTSYPTTLQQALLMLALRRFRILDLTGVTSIDNYEFYYNTSLREVYVPDVSSYGQAFSGCTGLRYIEKKWSQWIGSSLSGGISAGMVNNIVKLGVKAGQGWNNLNLSAWNPATVIANPTGINYVLDAGAEFLRDGATAQVQTNLDQLNYGVQTCIAARLDAWTEGTTAAQPTVTLAAALYNVLSDDTKAAFAAKGWELVSA